MLRSILRSLTEYDKLGKKLENLQIRLCKIGPVFCIERYEEKVAFIIEGEGRQGSRERRKSSLHRIASPIFE